MSRRHVILRHVLRWDCGRRELLWVEWHLTEMAVATPKIFRILQRIASEVWKGVVHSIYHQIRESDVGAIDV